MNAYLSLQLRHLEGQTASCLILNNCKLIVTLLTKNHRITETFRDPHSSQNLRHHQTSKRFEIGPVPTLSATTVPGHFTMLPGGQIMMPAYGPPHLIRHHMMAAADHYAATATAAAMYHPATMQIGAQIIAHPIAHPLAPGHAVLHPQFFAVTSPTSDEIIPSDPSLQYPSPKGAIYAAPDYYMDHGSPDPWGNHITSSRPPVSIAPSGYAIHTEMPYPGIPPEGVDSRLAVAGASGLPPMSSFRQHGAAPSPPVNTTAQFVHPSPSVNGSNNNTGTVPATAPPAGQGTQPAQQPPNTAQTADALGKALASMYSTDAHSSTSYSSNPATPVASPPPLISDRTNPAPSSTASTGQPASGTTPAPSSAGVSSEAAIGTWTTAGAAGPPPSGVPYDNLHNLNRMQETLEDAIWVLKSHAESTQPNPAHIAMGGFPPASYPQALTDQLQNAPIDGSHTSQAIENATNILSAATSAFGASGNHPQSLTPATDPPPKGTKRAGESKGKKRVKSEAMDKDEFMDDMNDQDQYDEGMSELSGPDKQGRESERRHANNARERVRVRDINLAFKELGRMCAIHLKNDGPQTKIPRGNVAAVSPSSNNDGPPTKLTTLHQAVTIITSLESQVRERNLNPKAACLKRRGEEEKMNEDPNDRSRMGMNISGDKNRGAQQPRRGFENPLDNSGGLDPGIFSH